MEVLCHQLESGIENGAVVCSTGRIVRILSVYDGIDGSAQKIIPEWALDQELANMAFRVRELILSKATEAERSAYDSAESNVLAERMNEEFTKEASAAYKDIVSTDTLRLKMNVYREGF
jgi:replicative DNA helicase